MAAQRGWHITLVQPLAKPFSRVNTHSRPCLRILIAFDFNLARAFPHLRASSRAHRQSPLPHSTPKLPPTFGALSLIAERYRSWVNFRFTCGGARGLNEKSTMDMLNADKVNGQLVIFFTRHFLRYFLQFRSNS